MTYSRLLTTRATTAITVAGLVLLAPPASGKSPILVVGPNPEDVVSRHISYADLNLASAAGERALDGRVGTAVSSLCSEATGGDNGSLTGKLLTHRCSNFAWDQARPQISLAVQRAHEFASTGTSSIAAVAITVSLPE